VPEVGEAALALELSGIRTSRLMHPATCYVSGFRPSLGVAGSFGIGTMLGTSARGIIAQAASIYVSTAAQVHLVVVVCKKVHDSAS